MLSSRQEFAINFVQKSYMRKHLLFILHLLAWSLQGYCSHIIVSGNVSGNWNVDTVFVADNLQVQSGQVLTISPGSLVLFNGHYSFRVDGQVLATGTPSDSIVFKVADTTGFSNLESGDGSWDGFWFYHLGPVNDSTIFEYCRFEYSKAAFDNDTTNWYGGAVCAREFDRMRISNCSFVNNRAYKNGGAIYARLADIKIEDCRFESNFCGQPADLFGYGGGVCLEYADAMIHRNYFTLNRSTGVGGGLSWEYSEPSVVANHFFNNYSALGGGFVCLRSSGTTPVVNNLVEANSSLFFGGGIAVLETTMPFTNNTVVANYSGAGGGLYFNAGSFSVFKNCVIWDNYDFGGEGPQVYIWDTFSAPEFYYCVVEGGVEQFGGTGGGSGGFIGVYQNCYEADPNFSGAGEHPFQPQQNSICINNGTPDTTGLYLPFQDIAGTTRILNFFVDIGAYETLVITSVENVVSPCEEPLIYPNPFHAEVNIIITTNDPETVRIWITDINGRVVKNLENSFLLPGSHRYQWSVADSPGMNCKNAIYYLNIKRGDFIQTRKLMVIN